MSFKVLVGTLVLAVALTLGLLWKIQTLNATIELTNANNQTLTDSNVKLRVDNAWLQELAIVREQVAVENAAREDRLGKQLVSLEQVIRTYEPKEDTDESRCLDLRPPDDYLEWLQQTTTN